MRSGMGNLLETDSDVASISDNEKERTDGDGMESEAQLDTSSNVNSESSASSENVTSKKIGNSSTEEGSSGALSMDVADKTVVTTSSNLAAPGAICSIPSTSKSYLTSPKELPPRSQLIQLKPTMRKPRLSSKNSTESSSDNLNKQKNPRFIPYEPYRGAVRPIVAEDELSKRHSRSASDASLSSLSLEQAMNNISLDGSGSAFEENVHQTIYTKKDTLRTEASKVVLNKNADHRTKQKEQIIEKQTHALTLLKESLKIAEKDNFDLHKENTRLKKLLVDSLSGDLLPGRPDLSNGSLPHANNESVDALSNEIEVWRSKFLSSCVLVEQLTRENGTLNEAVATAVNILKEIKLSSTLSPEHFEEVNLWLRQNRGTTPSSMANNED